MTNGSAFTTTLVERGGKTGALIAARDWSTSPLGTIESWPVSLRTTLSLILLSPVPIVLLWGPEGIMLYNDAYSVFAGGRHPALLGARVREGWPEVADFNAHVMDVGLAGGTLAYRDQQLTLYRHGRPEPVWMNLDYSPVLDEHGRPAGVIAVVVETTERVLADLRLANEHDRLLQTFEQAPGFIMSLEGPQNIVRFVNAAHRRLFASEDWVGRGLRDVLRGSGTDSLLAPLDQVLTTGERVIAEATAVRLPRADGTMSDHVLSFVYEPIRDPDGRVRGVLCEGSDITDRTRAESALLEETRSLETLNRVCGAVAGELALEPLVQMITDAGVALTGAQFGSYFHNVMDESGERLHLFTLSGAALEQFVKLGRPRMTGVFGPTFRNEGVIRSDDIRLDPRYGHNGPHQGMPKGHLPVRSYLAVPVVSRSGTVLGGLLFGHPEPGRFTDRHERLMLGLAAQAAIAIDNARLFQQVQEANATLEQRVAERTAELIETQGALHQAQKMEAIGQLTGGIAHDFNNLLTGINGSLEIIEKQLGRGRTDGLGRFISAAQDSARRAASLTQRLLAFSRRQTLDPKPTDVNRLVFGMEDLIRRTVGPGIRVDVVAADGLWLARIDPVQLESALLNLAINSRDAMVNGGCLTIETANRLIDGPTARALGVTPGEYLSIRVEDTGSGIGADIIDRIFDPFFTTKPIGQGTGLGLSMIHGFVRQSGGAVQVRSNVGTGTSLCLFLPRFDGGLPNEVENGVSQVERGAGETVLVIDDESAVRMLIADVLEEAGYGVLAAEDGPSGLQVLRSEARIDLLVTDVGLPGGMNGRQVAEAARVLRPQLKVLFITGFAQSAILGDGTIGPGMQVLTKPFSLTDLSNRIGEMIQV